MIMNNWPNFENKNICIICKKQYHSAFTFQQHLLLYVYYKIRMSSVNMKIWHKILVFVFLHVSLKVVCPLVSRDIQHVCKYAIATVHHFGDYPSNWPTLKSTQINKIQYTWDVPMSYANMCTSMHSFPPV